MKRLLSLLSAVFALAIQATAQTTTVVSDSSGKVVAPTNLHFGRTFWFNSPNAAGLQVNRLSQGQINLLTTATNGSVVYNTTTEGFQFRQGGVWVNLGAGGGGTSVSVNGAQVTTPNFTNSGTSFWSVTGSNVVSYPTNVSSGQIADLTIVDADVAFGAGILRQKLATGVANGIAYNNAAGFLTSHANLKYDESTGYFGYGMDGGVVSTPQAPFHLFLANGGPLLIETIVATGGFGNNHSLHGGITFRALGATTNIWSLQQSQGAEGSTLQFVNAVGRVNAALFQDGSLRLADATGTVSVVSYPDKVAIYSKDTAGVSKLYYKGDDGVEVGPLGAAGGTVSSVGLTVPNQFSVSGSPVTAAGTLAVTLTNFTGTGGVVLSGGPLITNAALTTPTMTGRWTFSNLPTNTAANGQVLKFDGTDFVPQNDSTGGAGSLYVNGSPISDANLITSPTANVSVSSSTNVSITPTNLINNQISASAAIDKTKISTSGAWSAAELGTGTADNNGFLRGDQAWTRSTVNGQVVQLIAGTLDFAAVNLADGNSVTGTLADGNLSANVVLENAANVFSGANNFSGVNIITNTGNTIAGNGAGLTAVNAATSTVIDSTDATSSVLIADSATGNLAVKTDAGLTYNATTGTLTATGFAGPLTGNVTGNVTGNLAGIVTGNVIGNADTATVAATSVLVDSTDSTSSLVMVDSATGNLALKTDAGVTYNAANGTLTATTFAGAGGGLTVDASGFNLNLTTGDNQLQEIAQKFDDFVAGVVGSDTQVTYNKASVADGADGVLITAETNLTVTGTISTGTSGAGSVAIGSAGVVLTDDTDGALIITGAGNGSDEAIKLDLDNTANNVVISSPTAVTNLGLGTIGVTSSAGFTGPLFGNSSSATTLPAGTTLTNLSVISSGTNWDSLRLLSPVGFASGIKMFTGIAAAEARNWGVGINNGVNGDFVIRESSTNGTTDPFISGTTRFQLLPGGGASIGGTVTATTFAGAGGGLTLTASGFNQNLAPTDDTLQEVAQKVDDLTLGDPVLIGGVAVTDAAGVDLIGGAGIDITHAAGASPDTATFAFDGTEIPAGLIVGNGSADDWTFTFDISAADPTLEARNDGTIVISRGTAGSGLIAVTEDADNGSNIGILTAAAALGADRTYTFPDASGEVALHTTITNVYEFALSDETTALTTGTAKLTWRAPHAMTIKAVRSSLSTTSSSGLPTVDINEGGSTILSAKLSIDVSEKTSTTAATPAVLSDTAFADDAEITFDVDVAGTGAAGLKIKLYYVR